MVKNLQLEIISHQLTIIADLLVCMALPTHKTRATVRVKQEVAMVKDLIKVLDQEGKYETEKTSL